MAKDVKIRINAAGVVASEWVPLDKCNITPEVMAVHCDTRDFGCLLDTDIDNKAYLKYAKTKRYTVNADNIVGILQNLREMTGGNIKWRLIRFKNCGWLKYIRFYRITDDKFVAMCRDGQTPLDVTELNSENIELC